ncbi:hypothetical protein HDU97_001611 [Phlyctochytrium planicorne]|nr:hypothetical protein HDU97_001611 [Phlyctochytrium planicorne]
MLRQPQQPSPKFIVASTDAEKQAAYTIRNTIFIKEQGYPYESDTDGLDDTSTHIIGLIPSHPDLPHLPSLPPHVAMAAARVWFSTKEGKVVGRVGRIAVVKEMRGMGYGAAVVKRAEEALMVLARRRGEKEVRVDLVSQQEKQLSIGGFYEKLGYVACGEPFKEDWARHVLLPMTKLMRVE